MTGTAGTIVSSTERTAVPTRTRDDMERLTLAALAIAEGIGPRRLADLVAWHGSATRAVRAATGPSSARRGRAARSPAGADRPGVGGVLDSLEVEPGLRAAVTSAAARADDLAEAVEQQQLSILTLDDDGYPGRLRAIELPPPVLFVRGDRAALEASSATAIVGTRRATELGRRTAARLAGAVTRAGSVVVSGLAMGIDGTAHRACLAENGRTVAVLGSGHGEITPTIHRALADRIVEAGGAVVSEFAPWLAPTTWSFPRRNRLISGLADATLVVEAGEGSGALITAGWALEQGRECFLVPGPLGAATWAGSNAFLRVHHGVARIVADVTGLLEDLGLTDPAVPSAVDEAADLGPTAMRVAAVLAEHDATIDALVEATDLPSATILAALVRLEEAGLVHAGLGHYRATGRLATRAAPSKGRQRRRRAAA